jgi:hypothetical protein
MIRMTPSKLSVGRLAADGAADVVSSTGSGRDISPAGGMRFLAGLHQGNNAPFRCHAPPEWLRPYRNRRVE